MNDFSRTVQSWRRARRFSQLSLAVEADVSTRHISFLETGRARPSVDMIKRLGDALQLPLAARNQMLTFAGFAVQHHARSWSAEEMAPIRAAVDYTLNQHAPYPALAIDRLWTIVQMNGPARALFGPINLNEGDSLLDLMLSDTLPPLIENWPEVAHHAAQRLRTESTAQGGIIVLDKAAEKLAEVPKGFSHSNGPVIPTIFRAGSVRLSLFTTIAQFGTPEDLTLDDLRIELYFPADLETEEALRALAA
ncbi:helix-turn-helix domain-containing protein [Pararhizobium sp. IMCC21322]|uniref:helix-turn-helix domain-containing protein n=1 Tax=Pararhizobium sp. IMCC21322 TaxID=3067903 RepID=UPI0027424E1A|nr:helix-turn-helix transcriptional regulator [Pararhizobium sp. IMCC21322]